VPHERWTEHAERIHGAEHAGDGAAMVDECGGSE
jgi:hypothetical protein